MVADTNIFLAVALNEPEKSKIIRLSADRTIIAPEILPFEIGNALSAMLKKNIIKINDALSVLDEVIRIPVELKKINLKEALTIAGENNIYAYDAYFIQCAIENKTCLLTLDKHMRKTAENLGVKVLD